MFRRPIVACILNGGQSARFGRDKAEVLLGDTPVLSRIIDACAGLAATTLLIGRPHAARADIRWLPDATPGAGPLQAALGAFEAAPDHDLLLLPCDLPRVTASHLAWLAAPLPAGMLARAIVHDGTPTPIPAFYDAAARATFASIIASGRRALQPVLKALPTAFTTISELGACGLDPRGLDDFDTAAELDALI